MFVTYGDVSSFELLLGFVEACWGVGGLDMGGGSGGGGKKGGANGDLGGFDSSWWNS